jgi:hypothetical protein
MEDVVLVPVRLAEVAERLGKLLFGAVQQPEVVREMH